MKNKLSIKSYRKRNRTYKIQKFINDKFRFGNVYQLTELDLNDIIKPKNVTKKEFIEELRSNDRFISSITSDYFDIGSCSPHGIEPFIDLISPIAVAKYINSNYYHPYDIDPVKKLCDKYKDTITLSNKNEIKYKLGKATLLDCWKLWSYYDISIDMSYNDLSNYFNENSNKIDEDFLNYISRKCLDYNTYIEYILKYILCNPLSSINILKYGNIPINEYTYNTLSPIFDIDFGYDTLYDVYLEYGVYDINDLVFNNKTTVLFDEYMTYVEYIPFEHFKYIYEQYGTEVVCDDIKGKRNAIKELYIDNTDKRTLSDRENHYEEYLELIKNI